MIIINIFTKRLLASWGGGECSQIQLFLVLISYCGWWLLQVTATSCTCFGHSSHFVAKIYIHHYVTIPLVYVLMFWLGGCILSWLLNYTGMILSSLYWKFHHNEGLSLWISFWVMITTAHSNTKTGPWNSERESFFFWIVSFMVCCLYVWMTSTRAVTCTSVIVRWFAMYPSVFIMVLVHLFLFFAFIVTIQLTLLLEY